MQGSQHKDVLAMLRANKDRSQGTRTTRATWRRACVHFCPPSVYPDSWKVEPPGTRWVKEPLSLFELDPRGSRRQRELATQDSGRGVSGGTLRAFPSRRTPAYMAEGSCRTRKEQLRKRA